MALVAYSDESDISDEEEEISQVPSLKAPLKVDLVTQSRTNKPVETSEEKSRSYSHNTKLSPTSSNSINGINSLPPSGIESIIDEDEDLILTPGNGGLSSNQVLLSSLQAVARTPASVNLLNLTLDVGEDELTDVPTKETWKVSQDVLKKMAKNSGVTKSSPPDSSSTNMKNPPITVTTKSTANTSSSSDNSMVDEAPLRPILGKAQQIALASSALGSLLQKKKTQGGKVQLLLPALSEFIEDDNEDVVVADQSIQVVPKKAAPSKAGTGLFSLLPKPKNLVKGKEANRSLVPHNLFKKPQPPNPQRPNQSPGSRYRGSSTQNQGVAKNFGKKSQIKSNLGSLGLLSGEQDDSDDDNEEDAAGGSVDFFSLDAKESNLLLPSGMPLVAAVEYDSSMIVNEVDEAQNVTSANIINRISSKEQSKLSRKTISASFVGSSLSNNNAIQGTVGASTSTVHDDDRPCEPHFSVDGGGEEDYIPMTSSSSSVVSTSDIDDEAWRRLTGKKRKAEDIDIIDVNADDALLSREEWMNRAASQEKPSHSHSKKKGNLPSQQQKRKHQITYLAHQAKEREIELKNDWSAGKVKKQQTRAKYGF